MKAREYGSESGDFQMLTAWVDSHGRDSLFAETVLPPTGVVVEDDDGKPLAACWLHLSTGIGVAFLENPVTRPGLTMKEAREALGFALGALESIARAHDYGYLCAAARAPMARLLESRFGFSDLGERRQMVKRI